MRYVALLRGVNVGGRGKLPMSDLRTMLAALGFDDIATYIQSGNVVFSSERDDAAAMAAEIRERIAEGAGLDVGVQVRTADDLVQVLAGNPFLARTPQPSQLHVSFLSAPLTDEQAALIDPTEFEPDEVVVKGRMLYLWCPNGMGRTKIPLTRWERRWGVDITTRNWNTVTKLLDMARSS